MAAESKLVRASRMTRTWLRQLRQQVPVLEYTEAKYWATFKAGTAGTVAQLNPSHIGIRVFLRLDSSTAKDLKPSPSTRTWGTRFPSVFQIVDEFDVTMAGELIGMAADAARAGATSSFTQRSDQLSADEVDDGTAYQEGAVRRVTVNAYERNQDARGVCLRHYGSSCVICGFNFLEEYGADAAGYIQVHHV